MSQKREPDHGRIEGQIPPGEAADVRDSKDPKTVRTEPVLKALRVDAKEASKRGRHRAQD
jgi:hypothetical protein